MPSQPISRWLPIIPMSIAFGLPLLIWPVQTKGSELTQRLRNLSKDTVAAWGIYGAQVNEEGLKLLDQTGEGITELVEAGGRKGLGVKPAKLPGVSSFYVRLDDWVHDWSGPLDVFFEYFDGAKGTVSFRYSAEKPGSIDFPRNPILLTGSKTWKVAYYRVEQPAFGGRTNFKSDLAIVGYPIVEGFVLGAVAALPAGQINPDELLAKVVHAETTELSKKLLAQKPKGGWAIYGQDVIEHDLELVKKTAEGLVEIGPAGGRQAVFVKPLEKQMTYYWFRTPASLRKASTLEVFLEYFDGAVERVEFRYSGPAFPRSLDIPSGWPLETDGSMTWKTTRFTIKNACFKGVGNDGCDISIGNPKGLEGFAIGAIAVVEPGELK